MLRAVETPSVMRWCGRICNSVAAGWWLLVMVLFFAVAAVELFVRPFSDRFAAWPFAIGLLTIGMWHGAIDSWKLNELKSKKQAMRGFALYFLLLCASAGILFLFPATAIVAFLVLTAIHFGGEDFAFLCRYGVAAKENACGAVRGWLVSSRGLLVIGLPLVIHPVLAADFFRRVEIVVGRQPTIFPWESIIVRVLVLLLITFTFLASIWKLRFSVKLARRWCVESVLLVAASVVLNPEFFVGLYLLLWHAPRHLLSFFARSQYSRVREEGSQTRQRLAKVFGCSMFFLLPAWAAVGALVWQGGGAVSSWLLHLGTAVHVSSFVAIVSAATVAVYVIVTLPHHLLQTGRLIQPFR